MNVYEQIGIKVQKLRRDKGWSQEELAERCGLHRTYISHIENGKREISVETLCRLAAGLELFPSDLLEGIKVSF